MSNTLPPPPYKTKFLTAVGYLVAPWNKFIRELYNKVTDAEARIEALEQEPSA